MNSTELTILGLLVVIAGQTTYTTYRTWKGSAQQKNDAIFVDTSVLIDGRIVAIAQAGFIPGKLIIPRSVVGELQFLADNADSEKRGRARQGLDVVNELQAMEGVIVEILQDGSKAAEGVDERLLKLAKKYGGRICTIDFNLNKVAQVEDIIVLNVNELAKNLRMAYLPGDTVSLELTTAGSDSHQAVGHLDDGTMVVVEQARKEIGQIVEVEIIRSLQTAAGRMMFAKQVNQKQNPKRETNLPPRKNSPNASVQNGGRKALSKPKSTHKPSTTKTVTNAHPRSNQSTQSKEPTTKHSSKPRNNEDRLISLVNAQDE